MEPKAPPAPPSVMFCMLLTWQSEDDVTDAHCRYRSDRGSNHGQGEVLCELRSGKGPSPAGDALPVSKELASADGASRPFGIS